MTDGIKITCGDELSSLITPSTSTVTFSTDGLQKITFDDDTFENMDAFYDHIRSLRAENARVPDMEARILADAEVIKAVERLAASMEVALANVDATQEQIDEAKTALAAFRTAMEKRDE